MTRRTRSRTRSRPQQRRHPSSRRERGDAPASVLDGVPKTLPALLRAYEIGSRVAAVGFDWNRAADIVDKIDEEVAELRRALDAGDATHAEEEMGDLLFSIANLARRLQIEPEAALRKANDKFTERFRALEARLQARGRSIRDASLDEMEQEWQRVKKES